MQVAAVPATTPAPRLTATLATGKSYAAFHPNGKQAC